MFRWHRWQFGVRTIVMVLIFKETFKIFNLCLNDEVFKLFLKDESIENIQLLSNLFFYVLIFIREIRPKNCPVFPMVYKM